MSKEDQEVGLVCLEDIKRHGWKRRGKEVIGGGGGKKDVYERKSTLYKSV